jgi:hypothetical protein
MLIKVMATWNFSIQFLSQDCRGRLLSGPIKPDGMPMRLEWCPHATTRRA